MYSNETNKKLVQERIVHQEGTEMEKQILLTQDEVKSVITMEEVVDICDRTFEDMGNGKTINPAKVVLDLGEEGGYPHYEGFMNAMPSYVGWLDVEGMKWAGGFLGERKKLGLPFITSLILLFNPKTGNFTSVIDRVHITNLRTGAQTAVALKHIKHQAKSIRVGLYGAGQQARTQTIALSTVFEIEELTVYDIYKEASEKFAEEMAGYVKGDIKIAENPKEAADADTIICVTQTKDKFLKDEWIKPGTVVFPMGSYQECEDEFILNADHIIVDHVEQCLHRGALRSLQESGKITEENIFATIGEVAAKKKVVVDYESKRIVCIPIGTGAMDIAVAKIVFDKATEQGLGKEFLFN